jgi:murein L,D-transpeptidase YafK
MRKRKSGISVALCALFTSWAVAASAFGEGSSVEPPYALEISKSERVLLVKNGDKVTRRFQIATGRGGLGDKRIRGDNKTPLGVYRITDFNDASAFHFFMRLNYPNVKDAFFGLKNRLITRGDFDRIVDSVRTDQRPPQNTILGSAIGIHGLGEENADKLKVQRNLDWTQGCIALTNRDVNELRNYVTVGTKVVIRE